MSGVPPTVLIAGGGPVGLMLAALLTQGECAGRLRVRVLEPRPAPRWEAERLDLRVYALSRASQLAFERLGVWDEIRAKRASPYRAMRVWQGDDPFGFGAIAFDAADIGEPDLGHIVEDRLLRTVLIDLLERSSDCELDTTGALEGIEIGRYRVDVALAGGGRASGALIVGADGSDSKLRALLGLPTVARPYGQRALVTHVETERPHEETAWQRFLPGGPLALLPLSDGRSSIVWSLPEAEASRLLAAPDDAFLAALEDASSRVLGRPTACAERMSFPLRLVHARRYVEPRAVVVGDAAHTVHPLAGQGMNLGFADAVALADVIASAVRAGEDPGDRRVLRRYERARKPENLEMLLAFDGLHRLFGLPAWAAPLRAAGLAAVDRAPAAKRLLIRRAMGLSGVNGHARWSER